MGRFGIPCKGVFMARSTEVKTKLPLDRWARLLGINPTHFNGIDIPSMHSNFCGVPWAQHEWQNADAVGIEQVARAIQQAEAKLEQAIHHRLSPSWEAGDVATTIRPYRKEFHNLSNTDLRGYSQFVKATWGHFISGGVRATETLSEDELVIYEDRDNDGYYEHASVVVEVDPDINQCQVYITPKDEPNTRIRPITTSLTGNLLTVTFSRNQAVKTEFLERPTWIAIDGTVDDNFIRQIDVYREYNDVSTNASLYWEREQTTRTAFIDARDNPKFSYLSYIQADWDAGASVWNRMTCECPMYQPDRVSLNYYAGYRDTSLACPNRDMSPEIEHIVAQYACTFLERDLCKCSGFQDLIKKYTRDLAFQAGVAEDLARYNLDESDLVSPFGTQYGAIVAWKWVQNWRHINVT